ncbi:MAG: tetratricopeptide repeat protein [Caulobacteraceae bacterium]
MDPRDGGRGDQALGLAARARPLSGGQRRGRPGAGARPGQQGGPDGGSARDAVAAGRGFYAIDPLKQVQAQDPRNWQAFSLLGVAYEQTERYDEAEAAWRQALALSPDNPAVLSNLAMHYAAKGEAAQAETLLRRACDQPGATVQERQNLALVLGLQGKLAEAEHLTRQDLPPDTAANNLAYLRAAQGAGGSGTPDLRPVTN